MGEWIPINELFDFQKGTLQSSKCTPGQYTFITAAKEWKTHNHFSHDCEALIFAMAASGSLGRTHYIKGKFISSDLCFILTPKFKLEIDLKFYHRVFNFLREDIVKRTSSGTSKIAINQTNFGNYRLPYFEIQHQEKFGKKLDCISEIKSSLVSRNTEQAVFLSKLRQAILQESVEGKLTTKWREEHPVRKGDPRYDAAALLEQIKTEKQKLTAEGKIRKEKLLLPIKPEEKPFKLPESWVWCRFQELTTLITDGKHGDCQDESDSGYFFLSAKDIQNEKLIYDFARQIKLGEFSEVHKRTDLKPGDICMVNTGATIGKLAIAPDDPRTKCTTFQKSVAVIKVLHNLTNNEFLKCFLLFDVKNLLEQSWGSAINNLLLGDLKNKLTCVSGCLSLTNMVR